MMYSFIHTLILGFEENELVISTFLQKVETQLNTINQCINSISQA